MLYSNNFLKKKFKYKNTERGASKIKKTFKPKSRQEKKEHGFRKRMKTRGGRKILKLRRLKGRKKISA